MLLTHHIRALFSLSSSFTVLGLKSSCRMQQVKKKYYELAKKYHPDINTNDNNAQQKFTQINQAYKYIVDNYDGDTGHFQTKTKQKTKYQAQDKYGNSTKFKSQKRQKPRGQQENYQDFYDYDVFFKHSKKFRKPKIGQDIYININITMQQSIIGVSKSFTYTRYEPCSACASKQFSACFTCGGKGQIYDRVVRQKKTCEYCSGKGFVNQCLQCLGASYILKQCTDKIYIEKGIKDKSILRLQKKGHSGYKANNGDLYITVIVQEDQKFKVDGNNVHSQQELDYVIAVCGGTTQIVTVCGMKEISIKPGTQSGFQMRIFNAGLKSPYSKRIGDHIVKFKIKIPNKLNKAQKQLFEQLND